MDKEIIFLVEEDPAQGFTARVLGYPIFSEAANMDELKAMIRDAVRCHFEETERPSVIRIHIVKDEVIPA